MTLSVIHSQREDGTWIAVCDMFPAWSYVSDQLDRKASETSLKRYIGRHVRFSHHGWQGDI